ncbi:ABC transporter permease [Pantoea cypripedii]|uniref:Arginine ABC transporter permease protein ArtM n=1 Tax=Pantoea cypripedii TaxID=55209 RepID=A0A6B9GB23_PANCY|nr:ABC transporter permease subunit [Pantoea cypripedii]QGY33063.1 ABC transporter permease [Pantoea cypripedii]
MFELLQEYGPRMLNGLGLTFNIVLTSVLIGAVLSLVILVLRMSGSSVLKPLAVMYIYFFRGTPLLAQTFLVYYGAGQFRHELQQLGIWWFFREAYWCTVFTFALNTAAYQAEIWRGAIQSVPQGQREAIHALGLTRASGFLKVIFPQAAIVALRPLGNELVLMMKSSAIASTITVMEVMGTTAMAFSRTFDFQVYFWAAIIYLVIVEVIRRLVLLISNRLSKHMIGA